MWISKSDRDRMASDRIVAMQECSEWKAKYEAVTKNQATCIGGAVVLSQEALKSLLSVGQQAKAEVDLLRKELEVWKQKYADEVQKRLALIEQMKG